jgi:diguanylate cyclase (GGDEF)-like protein
MWSVRESFLAGQGRRHARYTMSTILIVDDEPLIVQLLEEHLQTEGYDTLHAYSGEEALQVLHKQAPDLVILDLMLPGMDGYEVCRLMQQDHRLNHIPVIMLTARDAARSRTLGYQRGADDYMLKPFDTDELSVRVRAQLHHLYHETTSELTGLPGSQAIEGRLHELGNGARSPWSIIYIDMGGFTAFNETYSYLEGDELIKVAARVLQRTVDTVGAPGDFLGHVGGDKFVIITSPEKVEPLKSAAQSLFADESRYFYTASDQEHGYITALDKQGQLMKVPLSRFEFDVVSSDEA